jgi:preprotein translocase subunit SecE
MLDNIKLIVAVLLIAGGIGGFYYYADQSQLLRVAGLLVIAGVAIAIAMQTQLGRGIWEFATDARAEVRKVVWPTRQETVQTTLVVVVVVLLVAIILWVLDMTLLWAVRSLVG